MKAWFLLLFFCVLSPVFAINTLNDLQTQIQNNHFKKAIVIGEELKQLNPNSPSVLFYTALAYQKNNQLEQAKKLYLTAITHNTKLPEVYNNLAMIYVQQKDYDKAAETLTMAINSDSKIATAYANLSQIYRYMAGQAYQKVLDDGTRRKLPKTTIKQQLLASVDLQETLVTAPTKPIINKPIQVAVVVPPKTIKPTPAIIKAGIKLPSAQQAVLTWAKAWGNKNYTQYVNSYSQSYAPKKLTHSAWLKQRKKRISRPGKISITVSNFDIKHGAHKAYVNFDQTYRSNTYQDKVRKRMHLTLIDNQWFITSEVTLSVL